MSESQNTILNAKRIVIKVGSVLVSNIKKGTVKDEWIKVLCHDIQSLIKDGKQIILVSSGGVALGRKSLNIATDLAPQKIPLELKQASSAIGQFHMFSAYYKHFQNIGITPAQVLLTLSETENRRMHLNARETLLTLLSNKIVPVINENDTVSTEEIRFGDNDRLAVRVAQMVDADLVILLSTTDGLYTDNPHTSDNAEHVPVVKKISEEHLDMAGEAVPGLSTGGMKSKVLAAQSANQAGISTLIADGLQDNALSKLANDPETKSTLFKAQESKQNSRKSWIAGHINPKGKIIIDNGALNALKTGKSLLPIGVLSTVGEYERGDAVTVHDTDMNHIATGLCSFNSKDVSKIIGKSSEKVQELLGYTGRTELIHRDDLVMTK